MYELFLRLEFVNSMVAPVKADPSWAPFKALKYKELGLLISSREVGLPISQTNRLGKTLKIYFNYNDV